VALPTEEFFTAAELATILRVSRKTVLGMARKGALPCHQIGRTKRFRRGDVEVFLSSVRVGASDALVDPLT
jgi:excisionase family DNA binding protein